MKNKLPIVEIRGDQYHYDMEGKRLIPVNSPKNSISFSQLKDDPKYATFFDYVDNIKDLNQRSVHIIIAKHALVGMKPSKEEKAVLAKSLPQQTQSNQADDKRHKRKHHL